MARMVRRGASFVLGVVAIAALSCCSSDPAPGRADLVVHLEGTADLDRRQAECIADRLLDGYGPNERRVLVEDGLESLPPNRWSIYFRSVAACVYRAAR